MNYKMVAMEVVAFAVVYLMVAWPMVSATNVNIYFNGQVQATTEISAANMINKQINAIHDPSDFTYTDIDIEILLSSASFTQSVEKIYIYKCQNMNPANCVQKRPEEYDHMADILLEWTDISIRQGTEQYPQIANILSVIKLVGPNNRVSWIGSWDSVVRTNYDEFNVYSHEISNIDFYVGSMSLVEASKAYIDNFQMLPFNWAEKAVLQGASSLYGLGSSESEIEIVPPQFASASPQTNEITTINKDFYYIFSQTTSGISAPVTLNLNPSFTCGDNFCDVDLGETKNNCCYDCFCDDDEYCDVQSAADLSGTCKEKDTVSITVQPLTVPEVVDCTLPFQANLRLVVNGAPASMPDSITSYVELGDDIYTSICTKSIGAEYNCPITLTPSIRCGYGTRQNGPNRLNITIPYNDGPNQGGLDLTATFSDLTVTYDCACQTGYYCDSGAEACRPEGSIGLQIVGMTSYMPNYNPAGDNIVVIVNITNAPADMTPPGTANYVLGGLFKSNSLIVNHTSGTAQCIKGFGHQYTCNIPINIANYDHEFPYFYRNNAFSMTITYSDGGSQAVREISSSLTDVTIPSYRCGDTTCNSETGEESIETCCVDCGCPGSGKFCDRGSGCQYLNNVTLSVISIYPENLTDCARVNFLNITAKINNIPSAIQINEIYHMRDRELSNWGIRCATPSPVTGIVTCSLQVPQLEGCTLPYNEIKENLLNMTVSFPNGGDGGSVITRHLSTPFENFRVIPVPHCGTYECETDVGESGEICCIDCGCDGLTDSGTANYYCDYHPLLNPSGNCRSKDKISIVVERPIGMLNLESCEKSHRISVETHIKNQPSGMLLESWYAKINGESTSAIMCREVRRFQSSINSTYNCTIIIPAKSDCTQGDLLDYINNSLSFFISYNDGMGRRVAQTITTTVPPIRVTQSIRSIYDITQDAVEAMKLNLERTMEIMYQLLELMDFCIKITIVMTVIGIVGSFIVGATGPAWNSNNVYKDTNGAPKDVKFSGEQDKNGWVFDKSGSNGNSYRKNMNTNQVQIKDSGSFSNNFAAGMATTNTLVQMIQSICNMISQSYQLMLKMIDVENEIIKMQVCLELSQHALDSGQCAGREQSCFSNIQSCVNLGELRSAMSDANKYMNNVAGETSKITRSTEQMTRAWDRAGWVDDGSSGNSRGTIFSVFYAPGGVNYARPPGRDEPCNRYKSVPNPTSSQRDFLVIKMQSISSICYPVVSIKTTDREDAICWGTNCNNFPIEIDTKKVNENMNFHLYCFNDNNDYIEQWSTNSQKSNHVGDEKGLIVPIKVSNGDSCSTGSGGTGDFDTNIFKFKTFAFTMTSDDDNEYDSKLIFDSSAGAVRFSGEMATVGSQKFMVSWNENELEIAEDTLPESLNRMYLKIANTNQYIKTFKANIIFNADSSDIQSGSIELRTRNTATNQNPDIYSIKSSGSVAPL